MPAPQKKSLPGLVSTVVPFPTGAEKVAAKKTSWLKRIEWTTLLYFLLTMLILGTAIAGWVSYWDLRMASAHREAVLQGQLREDTDLLEQAATSLNGSSTAFNELASAVAKPATEAQLDVVARQYGLPDMPQDSGVAPPGVPVAMLNSAQATLEAKSTQAESHATPQVSSIAVPFVPLSYSNGVLYFVGVDKQVHVVKDGHRVIGTDFTLLSGDTAVIHIRNRSGNVYTVALNSQNVKGTP